MTDALFQAMAQSIIDGEEEEAVRLAHDAIARGIAPMDAINKGYIAGIDVVGERFGCGEMFLPQLVMAGEAMKSAIAVLEDELAKTGAKRDTLGTIVLATVEGDIHDIGKTLVGIMLSVSGFEVHDMGVDVKIAKLVDKAVEVDADIIGMSALLTTTMVRQRDVIDLITERGLRDRIRVMVGGAPVTRTWVEEIGADGYSEDAIGAVAVARQLVS
jgi:corrinoid protein of di/trimethylamine methyltransferase